MPEPYQILRAPGSRTADNQRVRDGACRTEGYLERPAGVRLYYCDWEATPQQGQLGPVVVIMHGFGEHGGRYDEFAEYLLRRGQSVCRFDARGHGRSSGQRGHVDRYECYVEDLCAFVDHVRATYPHRAVALLGHSNGGLIAIRAIEGGLEEVCGLVVTNPLIRLHEARRPVPDTVARRLSQFAGRLPLPNGVRPVDLTHDVAVQQAFMRDRWVHRVATPRWYWSTTLAGRAALREAPLVQLPLLTVVGELDSLVDPTGAVEFHERAASRDKQLIRRRGELHEVLNETDRRSLFKALADWLDRVCATPRVGAERGAS